MTPPTQRITRGFSLDDESGDGGQPVPRRIRTRQQIMNGEGRRPPAAVALELLAGNPFNPREALTDIEETAESLRAKGQIQPVTVVRRAAFLQVHPGQEDALGAAEYVVVDGNRRLAAAHYAHLTKLRIDVHDTLADSAADILESALIANVHRVDVPPLDQAKAVQELVQVHGSQGQVARRLGKTPAWVSQRLALLELTPELQEKVETGELKVEPARRIGRLPKTQQAAEAQAAITAVKAPRPRRPRPAQDADDPAGVNGVNASGALADEAPGVPATVNGVNTPAAQADASGEPDVTAESSELVEGRQPRRLPYDDAPYVAQHLHRKMTPADFARTARLCLELLQVHHPEEYSALLQDLMQRDRTSACAQEKDSP